MGDQKKAREEYAKLLNTLGPELSILLDLPLDLIQQQSSDILAEAIRRIRAEEVQREPGFDGQYGNIIVFSNNELKGFRKSRP